MRAWDVKRFELAMSIFDAACDLAEPERARLLAEACGEDSALRAAVQEMLAHDLRLSDTLGSTPGVGAAERLARRGTLVDLLGGPAPGARVGRYVVAEVLGEGGMGVVFRARDPELGRDVALKLVRVSAARDGGADAASERLLGEARALARLRHPNVVVVHDAGRHEGSVYMAMELVAGLPLDAWLRASPRTVVEILGVFGAAGRGLAAAHAARLVHGDFKPANVIAGDDGRVVVVDFGLARSLEGETRAGETARAGTPGYMAPEQLRGQPAGAEADQFAFAVALHEAVYGRRPESAYPAGDGDGGGPPPARGRVPPRVSAALARALAPEPAARHESMDALLACLEPRRRAALAVAALAALVALALVGLGPGWWAARAEHAREASAAARLDVARAHVEALVASGREEDALAALAAFIDHPDHQGTAAWARAQLDRAARAGARGDAREASLAYAAAFAGARDDGQRGQALAGLARHFARRWAWTELGVVLETLAALGPRGAGALPAAELLDLRARVALGHRDLGGAGEARFDAGVAPLLRALARVTPTAHHAEAVTFADLDGDGVTEAVLARRGDAELTLARAEPGFGLVARLSPPAGATSIDGTRLWALAAPPGSAAPLVLYSRRGPALAQLMRLAPEGALREEHRWHERQLLGVACARVAAAVGEHRCFAGAGYPARTLRELRPGRSGWELIALDGAARSDVMDLVAADLDGDGRDELVVARGPWQAFDVRVLAVPPVGAPELLARRRLGMVEAVAVLRSAADGAPLIAAVKTSRARSRVVFGDDAPGGEPPGIHVLAVAAPRLPTVAFMPLPGPATGRELVFAETALVAGDLDGDGRDDLAVTGLMQGRGSDTLLYRQLPDGRFAGAVVRGLRVLAARDLDGDGDLELVVVLDEDGRVVTLGAGASSLPPLAPRAPEPRPAPPASNRRDWERAEALVAMGMPEAAAGVLEGLAVLAGDPLVAADARLRAAELLEAARAALAVDGPAPATAQLGAELAARAIRDTLDAAAAPARAAEARARAARLLVAERRLDDAARLGATGVRPAPTVRLAFDEPLDARWRVAGPLGVRRDAPRGELRLETVAGTPALLSLPLRCDGSGRLALAARLEVDRTEWGSGLRLALRPRAGPWSAPLGILVTAAGGGSFLERRVGCTRPGQGSMEHAALELASPSTPLSLWVMVDLVPELAGSGEEVACRIGVEGGGLLVDRRLPALAPPASGLFDLVVENAGSVDPGVSVSARLRSIEVTGCELAAAEEDGPLARGHLLLAEGARAAALRAFAEAPPGDARAVAEAVALADAGQADEAVARLARASPDGPDAERALRALLRQRGAHGAIARAAAGRRRLERYARAWGTVLRMHDADPVVLASLAEDLELALDGPPAIVHALLLARAKASLRLGREAAARADLARMLALDHAMPPADEATRHDAAEAARLLARLEARAGEAARARALVRRALELDPAPELGRDRLRAMPDLAGLVD